LQERLEILINLPNRQKIEKDLEEATREEIKKEQEEYYLRQKQKIIERKLRRKGTYGDNEMRKYQERLEKEPYPDYVKKVIQEEIERYEMMPPNSSEASMLRTYID
jgi:ATP-dependent Lon protease